MKKLVFITLCVLLMAVVIFPACAPAKPAATTEPQKPAAATTEPATPAPAQPAVVEPPKPVEKPTSFNAATYSNDKNGFSLKYPKGWVVKDTAGDIVLDASVTQEPQSDTVIIYVIPKAADLTRVTKDCMDNYPVFKGFGAKAAVDSTAAVKLADGKTSATETILRTTVAIYDLYTYCLAVNKGDVSIIVLCNTVGGLENKALVKEIARTLTIK
jgi:pyruvate/2-oxoglutarate dehydrogenase complex dihydrolipoamide acyltransferase (E2) component